MVISQFGRIEAKRIEALRSNLGGNANGILLFLDFLKKIQSPDPIPYRQLREVIGSLVFWSKEQVPDVENTRIVRDAIDLSFSDDAYHMYYDIIKTLMHIIDDASLYPHEKVERISYGFRYLSRPTTSYEEVREGFNNLIDALDLAFGSKNATLDAFIASQAPGHGLQ